MAPPGVAPGGEGAAGALGVLSAATGSSASAWLAVALSCYRTSPFATPFHRPNEQGIDPAAGILASAMSAKRIVDVIVATVALMVFSPLILLIAGCIRVDSRGPILFRPEVFGLNGLRFRLLKFRSMVANAGELLRSRPELWREYRVNLKVKNDTRITRVGAVLRKWSLDEVPQLVN